ncbi:MAG: uracil-DNA glycosylase family protein [Chloroflexota bacterium]
MTDSQAQLDGLHDDLRRCRRCSEAGYSIGSQPVFSGTAAAQVIVVGQAPAKVEAGESGMPFGPRRNGQRSLLWDWLEQAGWAEDEFRSRHYLSAVTKCFPGKSKSGGGDRVPTVAERKLCAPWQTQELAIIQPKIIIAIGRVAIEQFLPQLKGQPLETFIGQIFPQTETPWVVVPLPHPSGVSRWLNQPENRAKVVIALRELRQLKEQLGVV